MWLKISFSEEQNQDRDQLQYSKITLIKSLVAPIAVEKGHTFRVSPVFPLIENDCSIDFRNNVLHFFNFSNAYRVIGRIDKMGSDELKKSIFFSLGLSSVILVNKNENIIREFRKILITREDAYEKWSVKDNIVTHSEHTLYNKNVPDPIAV